MYPAVPIAAPACFPILESTDFSGEGSFYFDVARLKGRQDIPRAYLHRHNYYHLLWMTRAKGTHSLDFEQYDVRDYSVFFLSPGQVHAWTSSVEPQGYVLNISTDFFAQMFPRADDVAKFPFFHVADGTPVLYLTRAQHDKMLPLLHEIERETLARHTGRYDVVRSYLLILLTQLRRLHPTEGREPAHLAGYSLAKRFMLLMENHYLTAQPMRQYATLLSVSERQLNDALRRTMGKTANQLVQDRVALEAKRMLGNTRLSVAEVAFALNFEDPAYFARFFKKITSLSPGAFRKKHDQPLI